MDLDLTAHGVSYRVREVCELNKEVVVLDPLGYGRGGGDGVVDGLPRRRLGVSLKCHHEPVKTEACPRPVAGPADRGTDCD